MRITYSGTQELTARTATLAIGETEPATGVPGSALTADEIVCLSLTDAVEKCGFFLVLRSSD